MPRKSKKRSQPDDEEEEVEVTVADAEEAPPRGGTRGPAAAAAVVRPAVAAHVRDRQRQVAEREAARLARPEARPQSNLAHANRKKSAVSSTPFGTVVVSSSSTAGGGGAAAAASLSSSWCGPFAVAREMIAQREQAKRLREQELQQEQEENHMMNHPLDAVMQQVEKEQEKKAHPALQWKSRHHHHLEESSHNKTKNATTTESIYVKRQKRVDASVGASHVRVPTLYDLVIQFVVDHFDEVEQLGQVDHDIRSSIAKELVAQQQLTPDALQALLEPNLEVLELVDCSQLPQDVLLKALQPLKHSLKYLVLDMCGRCMGSKVIELLKHNELIALSIGGAYLLKDVDAAQLIETSPHVTSLEFKACPLLGMEFCRALVQPKPPSASPPLVELSLEDLSLDESHLQVLASSNNNTSRAFQSLKSLSLRRLDAMNDEIMTNLLKAASNSELHHVDVSHNYHLTDVTLAAIRKHARGVRSLNLNGLKHLTSEGLEALFLPVPGTDEMPPVLHSLEVAHLHHQAVTDDVLQLVCQAASQSRDGDQGLVRLNVQGSSAITYASCEYLVQSSSKTLQSLNVSFCTQINDQGLGYLVQHCRSLQQLDIWGCAQVSDVFLDGHDRVLDASLKISGAWIKKNAP